MENEEVLVTPPTEIENPMEMGEQRVDPQGFARNIHAGQDELNPVPEKAVPESQKWFLAEGVAGEGDKPEFFNDKTFRSIAAQAKAWNDSRKKITELTNRLKEYGNIPEVYDHKLPKEVQEFIDKDDYLKNGLTEFRGLAKEKKMTQEVYETVMKLFGNYLMTKRSEMEENIKQYDDQQLSEIDPDRQEAIKKLDKLKAWLYQSFPNMNQEHLVKMMNSSAAYEVLTHIRHASPRNKIPDQTPEDDFESREIWRKRQSDPRMYLDPAYAKWVDKGYKRMMERGTIKKH
jgi:hypothetical protein